MSRVFQYYEKSGTVKPRNTRYPNARNSNCGQFFLVPASLYRAIVALTPDARMFYQLHILTIEIAQDIL